MINADETFQKQVIARKEEISLEAFAGETLTLSCSYHPCN